VRAVLVVFPKFMLVREVEGVTIEGVLSGLGVLVRSPVVLEGTPV